MSALLKNMAQRLSFRLVSTPLVAQPVAVRAVARTVATKAAVGKKELIATVQEEAALTGPQADAAVNAVLNAIVGTVAKGEKVTIVGFGTFEPRARAARVGRNPKTGAELQIGETVVPGFSAGKTFKQTVKAAHGK